MHDLRSPADHFRKAQADLPQYLVRTPDIINATIDADEWSKLGEFPVE